ncbi:hypothetical protein POPA111323_05390 [Polynucleobacter paneuropaeus]
MSLQMSLISKHLLAFSLLLALLSHSASSNAQSAIVNSLNNYLQKRSDAFMTITGYSLTPDVTTGQLKIYNPGNSDTNLQMTSVGGGDVISQNVPLYLEGTLALNRFDPVFTGSSGISSVNIPMHWNSITGTGGVGWDFPLTEDLRFRPIANVMLGHLESDASIAARYINSNTQAQLNSMSYGRMNTYGVGGSLMLDYEHYRPEQEIDIELRYTNIPIQTFDTSQGYQGSADSQSLGLWARSRIPTPFTVLDRPLRAVFELAHTEFLGNLRGALGFDSLSSVGTGLEIDRSASDPLFTRVRLMFRYQFGQNVQGTSIGIAASF